ncbi:uncharacterized protein HD556DRAFT_657559 [Suillus plorans]|uniref:Uncharacterized protein n=1 Tax=Suillus plorans TaxID=116603 RepID=A0A9P7AMD2_9AGAM|nr:uncharacterized protein HD556DRAFT_657559 [Suillus plorans]KAG1791461.1 hypothetical protein HD556DRAFT_657559 [Suillus plorans]
MAHPSNSTPSIDSAPPTISKTLPSVISDAGVQLQSNRSAGHRVQWSDPLVYTRGIPARQPQGPHPASPTVTPSVTFNHSAQHGTRTIAGAMEGLNLAPAASSTPSTHVPPRQTFQPLRSQLTSTSQAAHQGSSFITAPRNPNLRFIFSRRLLLAQSTREPLNPVDSIVIDDRPATSEPQSLTPVLNQPNGTVESTTTYVNGTPPPTPAITEDAIDLTLGSDEENNSLQKQPKNQKSTQKQRNTQILSTSIKVNTAKRRLDSESSETSEGGPQKRLKRKGALQTRLDSDSATSDIDHVSPGPRSSIEPSSSSGRFSSSSVEVVDDVVLDGPRSIADAHNNHAEPSISLNDTQAPSHSARGSGVSVVMRSYRRPAPGGSAVASSSRIRVEDMEVSDDEVETGDPQRALVYASVISRKLRMWAGKLKGISRAHIDALFEDNVVRVSLLQSW